MKKIILGIRKSPTKSEDEDKAIQRHKELLLKAKKENHPDAKHYWCIDVCSGDDEKNRTELKKYLAKINDYDYLYFVDVDRFSRSWLGLMWFHRYIKPSKCQLRFLDGTSIYDENGTFNPDGYMWFALKCIIAEFELLQIRKRTEMGRNRILNNPELRKIKYKGGKKGRTWKWKR